MTTTTTAPRRRVVTSADVHAASRLPDRRLHLAPGDLVTPLARDDAAELGVALVNGTSVALAPATPTNGSTGPNGAPAADDLEAAVRRIVTSLVDPTSAAPSRPASPRPVVHVDGRSVQMAPFPLPGPPASMDCRLADVVTADEHGASVAAGFMSLHAGSFPWTLDYDEVEYVIEGELHLGTDAGTIVGRPGDVLYIHKGTSVTFGTPSWTRFLYVTYPANWAGGS